MSHVPYAWFMLPESICTIHFTRATRVMSHMHGSCHMRHVPYEWIMPHDSFMSQEPCPIWTNHVTNAGVESHTWMNHVTKSIHTGHAAHGGDQTWNVWITRSFGFPILLLSDGDSVYSTEKEYWNFGDSRENVFDRYGDCSENLLDILAVVSFSVSSDLLSHMNESCHTCGLMSVCGLM